MVDMAHIAGLVAGGVHPTPVGIADVVTSTLHKSLGGPRAGIIMCRSDLASAIDRAVFPGLQGGPLMHVIARQGHRVRPRVDRRVPRAPASGRAQRGILAQDGLLGGGVALVTGGTDNHLVLVDLSATELTGADAEVRLDRAGFP